MLTFMLALTAWTRPCAAQKPHFPNADATFMRSATTRKTFTFEGMDTPHFDPREVKYGKAGLMHFSRYNAKSKFLKMIPADL